MGSFSFGGGFFGQYGQGGVVPGAAEVETAILDLIATVGLPLELVGASPGILLDLNATVGIPVALVGSHRGLTLEFDASATVDLDQSASRGE